VSSDSESAASRAELGRPERSRRDLLTGLAALSLAGVSRAQERAASAAAVWLDMDQAALDAAYDQAAYAPTMAQLVERRDASSRAARARLGEPQRFAYGRSEVETLEIFGTTRPGAPIHVHIHGGAWRAGRPAQHAFAAELFVRHGAHFVLPDFAWVQDAGGDLGVLAEQVRRAVLWVYEHASELGGDPNRIFVSGHSSGAHLAAVLLTTAWQRDYGAPDELVKGGLCCSGMYDLEPVRRSARSSYVRFTDANVAALSPQRHIAELRAPLIVAYGTYETPEFQRQARDFAAAVRAARKPIELVVAEGYNHFEIIETLANPYGLLGRAVLAQMGLATESRI
jgi:arylformamidase